ncbi:MAG: phage portal protein, partial [Clostridia bacterium]|nr:phage portal protein [Clostridia bacterium]
MITYQDYEKAQDKTKWIQSAITKYRGSSEYQRAIMEQEYMAGRNTEIMNTRQLIYDMRGIPTTNFTAANFKIRNRLIHRLVTDRCSYSLGNGISFTHKEQETQEDGTTVTVDATKEKLGDNFDQAVYQWAYWAQSNGAAYLYAHIGHDRDEWQYTVFRKTEFLPLYDERTGALRGGIRFWSIEWGKRPINAVLYTETGYTRYETPEKRNSLSSLEMVEEERPYVETVNISDAYGEEITGEEPLPMLPIFPLYSGENRDSSLDNLKPLVDAYDMILSGFANDLKDCAQVYWLISGGLGMSEGDKRQLLDRLILQHMAVVDGENSSITPYTQDIPYNAREAALKQIRNQMYENFGGF